MHTKGFTLLFASLAISLLLAIGLSIASISLQQFQLASSGRESHVAFYMADSGVECGLYYDRGGPSDSFTFPTSDAPASTGPITCATIVSSSPVITTSGNNATSTYSINPSGGSCVITNPSFQIIVAKKRISTDIYYTEISSRGYNSCDATNPRRVERGLLVKY